MMEEAGGWGRGLEGKGRVLEGGEARRRQEERVQNKRGQGQGKLEVTGGERSRKKQSNLDVWLEKRSQ